jgi:iron complex transport system permease protein
VAARLLLRPLELPVGIMTALIGGPFFVYLVRWHVKR